MWGKSLFDVVRVHAKRQPDKVAYRFLSDGESEGESLTYGELVERALGVAGALGGHAGSPAVLLYPPGLDFVVAFFACLAAGLPAVPTIPPHPARFAHGLPRLLSLVRDARPGVILTTGRLGESARASVEAHPELAVSWLCTTGELPKRAPAGRVDEPIAFIQYTSGSTSSPKGVVVTHENLLANEHLLQTALGTREDTPIVGWLPVYHDMGLIGVVLHAAYVGTTCVLMEPMHFLQEPMRWLRAISRYRAYMSGGPDFAYAACADRARPETLEGLDLSSWSVAFDGAEPVRHRTLERFAAAFAHAGFRREALYPCYGLAETTLFVSGTHLGPSTYARVDASALRENRVVDAPSEDDACTLVSVGAAQAEHRIVVVDDAGAACADDVVGEVWLSGPSVARGYFGREEASAETFGARLATGKGPFLRTGDLGFLRRGRLFVTGRQKDLIVLRGKNHYPQDVELTAEQAHPALRPGCGAAFSVEICDEERLVHVHEVGKGDPAELAEALSAVRRAILVEHGVAPYAVIFIRRGHLPKTTSGKVQRRACRAAFEHDALPVVASFREADAPPEAPPLSQAPSSPDGRSNEAVRVVEVSASRMALPASGELREWLVRRIAQRLRVSGREVDVRAPFVGFGLDSAAAVELSGELARAFGIEVAPTLLYDCPTIDDVVAELASSTQVSRIEAAPARRAVRSAEPIAIVGIGCRFPGARGVQAFWELLSKGVDAVREVPSERWDVNELYDPDPAAPGKTNVRAGGFLEAADRFDASFFGVSPREAQAMDPQQRLLLEVAWESLEHAGVVPAALAGSGAGVFIGIATSDYGHDLLSDTMRADAYVGTGSALSIAANRLSYAFDLRGPSLAVDTACSSSLVAVHLACRALERGECSLALAGGVNLVLNPAITINFTKAGLMAADGRCKTFDARADGYARGEGAALVVLRRLSDALRDGDRILAVVRGSAVRQDGRTNGLTAPSGKAQEATLRAAYEDARVDPSRVAFVEAHGTGTALGDPIEARAIARALGPSASGRPRLVGSVKTNVGHLEAAAGVAGLVKAVLALDKRALPPSLHFTTPNPAIPFEELGLAVPTSLTPLGENGAIVAGVSSFGFGGTNAHVVLETPPPRPVASREATPWASAILLSARGPEALRARVEQASTWLTERANGRADAVRDLASATHRRLAALEDRLAVTGASHAEVTARLSAWLEQGRSAEGQGVTAGRVPRGGRPRVAFVFPGQGSQWAGMARELLGVDPAFTRAIDEAHAALAPLGVPVRALLEDASGAWMRSIHLVQPVLFALQIGLAATLRELRIAPDAVIGHSMGEVAAAYVAGRLSLEHAAAVIGKRSRLLLGAPRGAMALVELGLAETRARCEPAGLTVAASNGPRATVVTGDEERVAVFVEGLRQSGVFARYVKVDVASHAPAMDPLLPSLREHLADVRGGRGTVAMYSTVDGARLADDAPLDAAYWADNLRRPVLFAQAVEAAFADGCRVFVELSAHPLLVPAMADALSTHDSEEGVLVVGSLRREESGLRTIIEAASAMWASGVDVDFRATSGPACETVDLPPYPFRPERHWVAVSAKPRARTSAVFVSEARETAASPGALSYDVSLSAVSHLSEHVVDGRPIVPGAVVLELASEALGGDVIAVRDLSFAAPLEWDARVELVLDGDGALTVYARTPAGFVAHARAAVRRADVDALPRRGPGGEACVEVVSPHELYAALERRGVADAGALRVVRELRRGRGEAVARLEVQDRTKRHGRLAALVDGSLQAIVAAAADAPPGLFVPRSIERVTARRAFSEALWAHARVRSMSDTEIRADVTLWDDAERMIATLEGVTLARLDRRSRAWVRYPTLCPATALSDATRASARLTLLSPALAPGLAARLEASSVVACFDRVPPRSTAADGIIDAGPLGCNDATDVAPMLARAAELLRALPGEGRGPWVVMLGRDDSPFAASLVGFARTAVQEAPGLDLRVVLLRPEERDLDSVAREIVASTREPVIVLRGSNRLAPRLLPSPPEGVAHVSTPPADGDGFRVVATAGELGLRAWPRRAPGPMEAELRVLASGVNFRDLAVARGLVAGDATSLGVECVGVVERVGEAVRGEVTVGEVVVGFASATFGRYALADVRCLVAKPPSLGLEAAAGIPAAYTTAYRALVRLAHLAPGESVLVHAAAGGVGLAALAFARRAGASVYATAGSDEKRALLRELGVVDVFSSRTADFASELLARTDGRGVDVVVNSLAGELQRRSLDVLAEGGRFIELGKVDIQANRAIALRSMSHNRAFFAVDLEGLVATRPAEAGRDLREALAAVASGEMPPPRVTRFSLADVSVALDTMAAARHTGKIVLAVEGAAVRVAPMLAPRGDGTYLVTGGGGALGVRVARWLVDGGARHLLLVGRSEPVGAGARAIAELRAAGADVRFVAADCADERAVARVLALAGSEMPRLRGVYHLAGVLDDATIASLDAERIARVVRPKVEGAWNLHLHTRGASLDAFVLFSSAAAVFGSPGQAHYAAANAFLGALAEMRRAEGLPALAIELGPVGGVGLAALRPERGERLAADGVGSLDVSEVLGALEEEAARGSARVVVAALDERLFGERRPDLAASPLFAGLGAPGTPPSAALRAELDRATLAERRAVVEGHVQTEVARVLRLAADGLDPRVPLSRQGLDSLMAIELRRRLERTTGLPLSAALVFRYPTVAAIAGFVAEQMGVEGAPSVAAGPPSVDVQVERVRKMTEEAAEEALLAELAMIEREPAE